MLHFLVQDIHCCLKLCHMEKILPLMLLEPIPGNPVYFAGLMNFKNKCIPVIDLRLAIGLIREQEYPLNIPLLLCSYNHYQRALIVDNVIGLEEIEEQQIEMHDEFIKDSSPFCGAITLEAGVSLLLNTAWVFALKLTEKAYQHATNHE
ncbi:MAG: chemotaxis protein CheW [Legionella sp.]|uniref:chemotaxis protein CheW n=1 Tax=Legionella sp. TaxID=459 RepID=UPI0039E45CAF